MSFASTTLRPGLLVALKTSITGNVTYQKTELAPEFVDTDGTMRAKWETEKTVKDAAEHERAVRVRSRARSIVTSVCSATAFGLLCPEIAEDKLIAALSEARAKCDEFNATATVTRIWFAAVSGRVASDDLEAVKAINNEVRQLMTEMEQGVAKLDVKTIRDAAARTKELGSMLTPAAQARITIAIEAARGVATKIKAAGETAALVVDRQVLQTLAECRTAFLDLDEVKEVAAPAVTAAALDFEPAPEPVIAGTVSAVNGREIEIAA